MYFRHTADMKHTVIRSLALSLGVVAAVSAFVFLAVATCAPSAHAAAAKGIIDNRLEYHGGIDLSPVQSYAQEMGPSNLNAKWTRVYAYWDQLQPYAPGVADPDDADGDGFNDTYVAELDTVVKALRAQGINVILTGSDTPSWARNNKYKKYFNQNNLSTALVDMGNSKVYSAFQKYAQFLASHFKSLGVRHFEVWNEPNLRLIPQVVSKKAVGPAAYLKMLKAFSTGARKGNSKAIVIAGATSRMGSNGTAKSSTSPQWFARYLKKRGAAKWFNAYSHHPYSTKGSSARPSAKPRRASMSITLGNLPVLLKIFKSKPFYLTEYCLATKTVGKSFVVVVSKANQARYLREAFALLKKRAYRQVKALLWYQVRDWQKNPGSASSPGLYTGLVDWTGAKNPAWWAFAGGTKIAISAPSKASASTAFSVAGTLTWRGSALGSTKVILQRRGLKAKTWSKYTSKATDASGSYSFSVKQTASTRYRVIWDGVCESKAVTVRR